MGYSPFIPTVYVGSTASYFTDTQPDALAGLLQSVRLTEGQDANRPFQRFRPSRLDVEVIIPAATAGSRELQAGELVWLEVAVGTAAAAVWFKGVMLTPDARINRSGRTLLKFSALDLSDAFNEVISVAEQTAETIAENIGQLFDGVGWPDNATWRDISSDLIEQLSSWEHDNAKAFAGLQPLIDTVGPPARMIVMRNGGLQVIKDVATVADFSATDADVHNRPRLKQNEDSLINVVDIEGTILGSLNTGVLNPRPLEYEILDGLASTEIPNVARRILDAYENGLNTIDLEFHPDTDRNQAAIAGLLPGSVIEYQSDTLGQTFGGAVSGLKWEWRERRAKVRANLVVQPPTPEVFGIRLYVLVRDPNDIVFVDVQTGLATTFSTGSVVATDALAYDPNNNILYGGDLQGNLYRINTTTGVGTLLFNLQATIFGIDDVIIPIAGLCYDHVNDILYVGSDTLLPETHIYSVNLTTGVSTEVGPVNLGLRSSRIGISALAIDAVSQVIYLTNNRLNDRIFASYNISTGVATEISNSADFYGIDGLTFDYVNNRLYGIEGLGLSGDSLAPGSLYRINPLTGALTRIGTTDFFGLSNNERGFGLAFMSLGSLVLDAPTGLALTESSGDITAAWNAVTDATGYVLEWREEGSGDAWQTVDVTAPPHTFTP